MRGVLFLIVVAVMGSTALVIRNNRSPKRVWRQAPVTPPTTATTDCVCVHYEQCNVNKTLNKYGAKIIEMRRKPSCGGNWELVCCKKEDQITRSVSSQPDSPLPGPSTTNFTPPPNHSTSNNPSTSLPSKNTPSSTNDPLLNPSASSTSTEDPDSLMTPPKVITNHYQSRGCGFSNLEMVGFRRSGAPWSGGKTEAQFGKFPWVVAILGEDEKYICGGSLIHPKVVLTGAHCVSTELTEKLVVRAGEWDRGTTKEILGHQDLKVAEVIEHEHYHSEDALNDVALLILKEPAELAPNVDTICLPTQDFNFDNSQCVASGWGKYNVNSTKNQVIMQMVDLPVVPRDTCQSILRTTRLGQYFELHDSFICAGGKKGEDTCKGDGGSPLMCPLKNDPQRYEQAGIVAWGIGCGDVPGVYINVARFRDWIHSELGERDINID